VRLVDAGRPIAEVADTVGLSDRQLHRRSLVAFGYGPKVLARILRLRRALALARDGSSFARASVEAGYADQAHLAREVRALAGAPLTQLT
jgi:AraC-like DNA-binding protein